MSKVDLKLLYRVLKTSLFRSMIWLSTLSLVDLLAPETLLELVHRV